MPQIIEYKIAFILGYIVVYQLDPLFGIALLKEFPVVVITVFKTKAIY